MFPWELVLSEMGAAAVVEMFGFLTRQGDQGGTGKKEQDRSWAHAAFLFVPSSWGGSVAFRLPARMRGQPRGQLDAEEAARFVGLLGPAR